MLAAFPFIVDVQPSLTFLSYHTRHVPQVL